MASMQPHSRINSRRLGAMAMLMALWLAFGFGPAQASSAPGGGIVTAPLVTPAPPARAPNIAARLVAETPAPAPGTTTSIAIAMTPAAGWHGYWENGGDAGFGMQVEWDLPPGVTVGPLRYPVPGKLEIAGLMNHVFKSPYALTAPLSVDAAVAPGTRLPVRARAQWLACTDTICVPERGTFAIDLVAGAGAVSPDARARFDGWRAALPQPLDRAGRVMRDGGVLRFALPLPASVALTDPHLFVATPDRVRAAAPQRFARATIDGAPWLLIETAAGNAPAGPATATLATGEQMGGTARGLVVDFVPGTVPPLGQPMTFAGAGVDWALFGWALGGALLGGLLLNLMPCVFPILSLKALSLARGGGDTRAVRAEALAYLAGAVLVALALGGILIALRAGGTAVGWAFQLQHPASILILLALAAAITASLAGLFSLPALGSGSTLASRPGVGGGFWTGALAAFVATPCSGPFMGAALGATLALPAAAALPVFGGLGLGLALPFVALAFIPALRDRLPRPGSWMAAFQRWLAVPMGLTVLALLWLLHRQAGATGILLGIGALGLVLAVAALAGRHQRTGGGAGWRIALLPLLVVPLLIPLRGWQPAPAATMAGAEAWSPARLAALRAAGRPVFVNFTADWCLTCKANEAGAIDRAETVAAFKRANVAVLVADWTNGDPVITRALERHGRNSVPLYLWYAPGAAEPQILPQILTPGLLAGQAAAR